MKAREDNEAIAKKLIILAKDLKIEPKFIATDHINIAPDTRYENRDRQVSGFHVRNSIEIVLKDTTKFEDLISKALNVGANHVHGIEFRTTELAKYRRQARDMAVKAAAKKAGELAASLSARVGKPMSIRENSSGSHSPYASWWGGSRLQAQAQNVVSEAAVGSNEASSVALGQIAIRASVSVDFELHGHL